MVGQGKVKRTSSASLFFRGAVLWLAATSCSDDSASGSSGSMGEPEPGVAAAELSDFVGRWTVLSRFTGDDDADRGSFELVDAGGELEVGRCEGQAECGATDWSCSAIENRYPGTITEDELRIGWRFQEDGAETRIDFKLAYLGNGETRGIATLTPCFEGSASCEGIVLGCNESSGLSVACEGDDFSGLKNCQCDSQCL